MRTGNQGGAMSFQYKCCDTRPKNPRWKASNQGGAMPGLKYTCKIGNTQTILSTNAINMTEIVKG